MDMRPPSLPVPSLVGLHTRKDQNDYETKPHAQSSGELGSQIPQPLRFLANSVSISVNSGTKQGSLVQEVQSDTAVQKPMDEGATRGPCTQIAASCACDSNIHLKLERTFFLSIQRRCFLEWRRQQNKKQWKRISRAKDEQIIHLLDKLEDSMSRFVMYCRKQKRRRLLRFWRGYVAFKRHEYDIEAKSDVFFALKLKSRVFRQWRVMTMEAALYRDMESNAQRRYQAALTIQCFRMWHEECQMSRVRNQEATRMESLRKRTFLRCFLAFWKHAHRIASLGRTTTQGIEQGLKRTAFEFWKTKTSQKKRWRDLQGKITTQRNARLCAHAYKEWHVSMEKSVMSRLLQQCVFSVHMIQNLFVDNTRLASIVDSGRWGEEQIQILHATADMLREEKLNLQQVLNQFPWSKDRRLFQSRTVQPSPSRASTRKKDPGPCPEVFLRLSGAIPPKKASCHADEKQTHLQVGNESPGDDVPVVPSKAVFERLAMFSGALQNSGGSIVTSVTTDHLSKIEDMYKVMKTVNASFEAMGFSPRI